MAGFNDVDLVRSFVCMVPGGIQESHIPNSTAFSLVFQAEAGLALHGAGGAYKIIVVVKDLSACTTVYTTTLPGLFGDANWLAQATIHTFAIPAQPAANVDHVYQAITVVTAGIANPIVEFNESDLFIIT